MQVNKLIIGEFMPKNLGLKRIHIKNPTVKTTETFLSLAQRTQTQEALEMELAKAAKKAPIRGAFDPKTQSVYYLEAKNTEKLPKDINSLVLPSRFEPGYLEALNFNNIASHDSSVLLKSPIFSETTPVKKLSKDRPEVLAEIMDAERQTKSGQRINGINF